MTIVIIKGNDLNVTIKSSPKLGHKRVCDGEFFNLTCETNNQAKHFFYSWYWLNQSKEGMNITVRASLSKAVYICKVSNTNGERGEASITLNCSKW